MIPLQGSHNDLLWFDDLQPKQIVAKVQEMTIKRILESEGNSSTKFSGVHKPSPEREANQHWSDNSSAPTDKAVHKA